MEIYLALLQAKDAKKLYEFEYSNRAFFETMVPSRGEEYYLFAHFEKRHTELLREQAAGTASFYLIKDTSGEIIGRINLVEIDSERHSAQLGYRIGEAHTRKGIAAQGLRLLLQNIDHADICEIYAMTTSENIGSQKVLEQNGFVQSQINKSRAEWRGQRCIDYIWRRSES